MILDSCGQGCGLIAAFVGIVGFGSFGVPLKGEAANRVDADPFVLQTYKSTMCFLTCWLALLLGESFHFTPMGILSGILWVSGGIAGIYGIRNAGLAISVGTWSGVTVLGSFAWGIFVFGERVHSIKITVFGMCLMLIGFVGMSFFTSPKVSDDEDDDEDRGEEKARESKRSTQVSSNCDCSDDSSGNEYDNGNVIFEPMGGGSETLTEHLLQNIEDPLIVDNGDGSIQLTGGNNDNSTLSDETNGNDTVLFLGRQWKRRTLGIIGAAFDGLLGGSTLVPMHYSDSSGLEYVVSFAIGAGIVTVVGWIIRFLYNVHEKQSIKSGWEALPSMHFKALAIPGALAGVSWSIGNIGQILSVTYLGESIGMSIVQCQMIVSGVWGILWFREIRNLKAIAGWTVSAMMTLASMIILGREHVS